MVAFQSLLISTVTHAIAACSFSLVELPRASRHFQAAYQIGVTCHSPHFRTDAVGLFQRRERRPFADEFFPHRLFALDALPESQIGIALFRRIGRLLRDAAAHRIDVEIGNFLRLRRPHRKQHQNRRRGRTCRNASCGDDGYECAFHRLCPLLGSISAGAPTTRPPFRRFAIVPRAPSSAHRLCV